MSLKKEVLKGKAPNEGAGLGIDQLNQNVADMSLDTSKDGVWKQVTKKNKNKFGSSAAKQLPTHNTSPKVWERKDVAHRPGLRGNEGSAKGPNNAWQSYRQSADYRSAAGREVRPQFTARHFESKNVTAPAGIPPPLQHGWNLSNRGGSRQTRVLDGEDEGDVISNPSPVDICIDEDIEDEDYPYTDEDDDLLSDDSDMLPKTHETRKQHRMLKAFFEALDGLSIEEINEPARQWHCPACQGGPGAIDWYQGLQPLMAHARTKGSKRVILHREFAELLDEDLRRRGTSVIPAGESFGKWEGLKQENKDHDIVWPPMVIVMNTKLEKDENEKWRGMGNQELLDYFSSYHAVKAWHSYGPQGHCGMSVLIFESSAVGYMEAERLHKHFLEQGTGRGSWDHKPCLFYAGGKRQLFGFLAIKQDLDIFNQHCHGKSKLKFEMRSYQEMVVSQMKQMSEDNQQLAWYKNKVAKEQRHSKALEESLNIVSEKLRKTSQQNRIVRQRTKMQTEQNKEEMVFQEQFFNDQIRKINEATEAKEDDFEKRQQYERKKVEQYTANASSLEDEECRTKDVVNFIKLQDKEMEGFVAEREKLERMHEEKKMEMKRRHWAEELELAREFDAALTMLMERYTPGHGEGASADV
ncbi:Protein SUPPRESSOR OF GENE SILENCING [Ancistrocladus abbreviatus]